MDRALNALEQMVTEFTKAEYGGVVTAIELVNEPWIDAYMPNNMPWELLEEFMVKAYNVVRESETILEGKQEVMVIVHDAFGSLTDWTTHFFGWEGLGHNWTNYALDTHVYQAWSGITYDEGHIESACGMASYLEETQKSLPVVSVQIVYTCDEALIIRSHQIVGEFSLGVQTFCVDYKDCFNLVSDPELLTSLNRRLS
jgi:glucan 1,3-beta-glucosidase